MSNWSLIEHWRGVSFDEIRNQYRDPISAEEVDKNIQEDAKKLEHAVLEGIIKNAKTGDLSAVDWLESRGLISLPGKLENG